MGCGASKPAVPVSTEPVPKVVEVEKPKYTAPAPPTPESTREDDVSIPGVVVGLRAGKISRKFVEVLWDEPNAGAPVDSYEARLQINDDESMLVDVWRGRRTRCSMHGLDKRLSYLISVAAVSELHGCGAMTTLHIGPRTMALSQDEASEIISAGMQGLHTRREISRGRASKYADPMSQTKKAATRRRKKRERKAVNIERVEAAVMIQTQIRRHLSQALVSKRKLEILAIKALTRRAARDICNGVMMRCFSVENAFISVDTFTSEMQDLSSSIVQALCRRVSRKVAEERQNDPVLDPLAGASEVPEDEEGRSQPQSHAVDNSEIELPESPVKPTAGDGGSMPDATTLAASPASGG